MATEEEPGAIRHRVGDIVRDQSRGTIAEVAGVNEGSGVLVLSRPAGYSWEADARQCAPADSRGMRDWDVVVRSVVGMTLGSSVQPFSGCAECGELNLERERTLARRQSPAGVYESIGKHRREAHSESSAKAWGA
jgi:hypothetical protein